MSKRLINVLSGRSFFYVVILLTIIQSIWFVVSVKYAIPADETYHFKFIEYYSIQPFFSGPIISDQGSDSFYLGDIERIPSYLYHYLLSFPYRIANWLELSMEASVLALMSVSVLFTISSLNVLRKTTLIISKGNEMLSNSVVLLMTLTGMFTWIGASINYDSLSILTFYCFLFYLVKLINGERYQNYYFLLVTLGISSILIKVTIYPSILFAVILGLAILLRTRKEELPTKYKLTSSQVAKRSLIVILMTIIVTLFGERIIKNAVIYQSLNPSCDTIHRVEDCLNNAIFKREVEQKKQLTESSLNGKQIKVDYRYFVKRWPKIMYDRLYFFFGHKTIPPDRSAFTSVFAAIFISIASIIIKRRTVLENSAEKIIFVVAVFYVALLFTFNLMHYMKYGAILGGYQGRYLLPAVPFLYYFLFKLFFVTSESYKSNVFKTVYVSICAITVLWFSYKHFPPKVFIEGTNATWYTNSTREFNLNLKSRWQNLTD
ncbi:DUF2142 domain-containing protein [Candidatus Berkelbacteria bacterium]|nr:DUF2142 domain-containing protein [Candidatus Berkelbacteria bacterium]